jgi:membrane fusion protein, multidrug efflux system
MSKTTEARRTVLRPVLMIGGVVALAVVSGLIWLHGGRSVSIDDALIDAARLTVSNDVTGIVAEVSVHEGQSVRKGDVLLRLDDRPFRIALDAANADLAQSALDVQAMKVDYQRMLHAAAEAEQRVAADQANFSRYADLIASGGVTRADYDDARFKLAGDREQLETLNAQAASQLARLGGDANIDPTRTPQWQRAQARVAEAERELRHVALRAPFDGIVTQVENVQPGSYLAAASPAMALVSRQDVWAEGQPKETELTYIRPGNKVKIGVDTYPGEIWDGVVESIAPATGGTFSVLPAQNTSGNWVKVVQRVPLRVRILPHDGAPELRAGMSVVLDIDTGHVRHLSDLYK